MTNQTFPYDAPEVNAQYDLYRNALHNAVKHRDSPGFRQKYKLYIKNRNAFTNALSAEEYKYFSFMIWMEGVARYTEFMFMECLAGYDPSAEFKRLRDFTSFESQLEKERLKEAAFLEELQLKQGRQTCWYTIGYAEGLILDKVSKGWKRQYWLDKFNIAHFLK